MNSNYFKAYDARWRVFFAPQAISMEDQCVIDGTDQLQWSTKHMNILVSI